MQIEIVEVIRRATQGMTQPFLCRCDDGNFYFAKGKSAQPQGLISEWICAILARNLGLPVAGFEILEAPEHLIESCGELDLSDLGSGLAFGSLKHTVTELVYAQVDDIPPSLRRDVLAFDWWVNNQDRTLSEKGGNPNLFWDRKDQELVVIDHNQAFDVNFSKSGFLDFHAFSCEKNHLFDDMLTRVEYSAKFEAALRDWKEICDSVPDEWMQRNADALTAAAQFDFKQAHEQLSQCSSEKFWTY